MRKGFISISLALLCCAASTAWSGGDVGSSGVGPIAPRPEITLFTPVSQEWGRALQAFFKSPEADQIRNPLGFPDRVSQLKAIDGNTEARDGFAPLVYQLAENYTPEQILAMDEIARRLVINDAVFWASGVVGGRAKRLMIQAGDSQLGAGELSKVVSRLGKIKSLWPNFLLPDDLRLLETAHKRASERLAAQIDKGVARTEESLGTPAAPEAAVVVAEEQPAAAAESRAPVTPTVTEPLPLPEDLRLQVTLAAIPSNPRAWDPSFESLENITALAVKSQNYELKGRAIEVLQVAEGQVAFDLSKHYLVLMRQSRRHRQNTERAVAYGKKIHALIERVERSRGAAPAGQEPAVAAKIHPVIIEAEKVSRASLLDELREGLRRDPWNLVFPGALIVMGGTMALLFWPAIVVAGYAVASAALSAWRGEDSKSPLLKWALNLLLVAGLAVLLLTLGR